MEPQRRYTQKVKKAFHISMASLDISAGSDEPSQIMCGYDGRNYLLCTLRKPDLIQCPLDLNFEAGTEVSFAANGKSHIHLTGYLNEELEIDDMDDLDEEDDLDEDVEEEVEEEEETAVNNKKRSQKASENGPPKKKSKTAVVTSTQAEEESDDELDDVEGEEEESDDDFFEVLIRLHPKINFIN